MADIDRDRLIDDLETLVRIESITGSAKGDGLIRPSNRSNAAMRRGRRVLLEAGRVRGMDPSWLGRAAGGGSLRG